MGFWGHFNLYILVLEAFIVKETDAVIFINNPDSSFGIAVKGGQVVGGNSAGSIPVVLKSYKIPSVKALLSVCGGHPDKPLFILSHCIDMI